MTVAQSNVSLLKNTNRSLKLEVAQQKHYIEELEDYKKRYPVSDFKVLLTNYETAYAEEIEEVAGLKDAIDAVIALL